MSRVAVIVSLLEQEYCRILVRGVTRYANSNGSWEWEVFLAGNPEVKRITAHHFDGVIFDTANPVTLAKWRRSKLPLVQVFKSREPFSVNYDERQIGSLAAEHLYGTSKRLVALGTVEVTSPEWMGERVAGFCEWAGRHDLPVETFPLGGGIPRPSTPFGKWTPTPWIVRWVRSLKKPAGIFCADIHLAREVMAVCRFLEISVPEDIAVLGVDDDEILCLMERPTLSAIITQSEKVGYQAAEMLDQQIRKEIHTPQERFLIPPAGVSVRGSTATVVPGNEALSKALALIRENAHQPLNISEIARSAGASRRALELRFRKHLGRSPHEELIRVRLDKAKALLVGTTLSLAKIAELSGFGEPDNFSRAFRRETKISPRAHRQKHSYSAVFRETDVERTEERAGLS
jgi:LacI family transcriptional regulator